MAATRNAHDSTSTKKDVVLWLWRTHNKVRSLLKATCFSTQAAVMLDNPIGSFFLEKTLCDCKIVEETVANTVIFEILANLSNFGRNVQNLHNANFRFSTSFLSLLMPFIHFQLSIVNTYFYMVV